MKKHYKADKKNIDCPFCEMDTSKLANTILNETKYFYITPSLGALVEGYILIISKRHINSMAELNAKEMNEYKKIIIKYRKIFNEIYNKYPIIFEHGTPNLKDGVKASSVIHAHTHVVNHHYKNENELIENLKFKRIEKIDKISLDKNYIFYLSPNNNFYLTNEFEPISQFMRVEIAKNLNLLNEYDWRKNKFENNIILTINDINNYFNHEKNKDIKYKKLINK